MGVDATLAQQRRPHAGAVDRRDGKPCRAPHPACAQVGARRRHHRLRAVGTGRSPAPQLVAGGQTDRRLRGPARAGEARRAAGGAGRAATTFRWWSSATASTARSSKPSCRQRFSPARCTARSSPRRTPAWTCSSIPASTRRSARPCRRRWRRACRSSPRTRVDRAIWSRPYRTGLLLASTISRPSSAESVDHLIAERQPLLGGRASQRAGPHLAGDLRRAARPLRGGASACGSSRPPSPAPRRRPAATLPTS